MAKNKVEITGISTSNIKVIKSGEMKELFLRYKEGDLIAKEKLIYGNMKLILSILKKYRNKSDNLDDLFQTGVIGLIKAIDNFDLSHGVKFSTYAVPMISGEIKRHIRDNNAVRISRSIKELSYKIIKFKDEFICENGREPKTSEIADSLKVSEFEIASAIKSLKEPMSISEPFYNDGGDIIYLEDKLEDKKDNVPVEEYINLRKAINKLKKRERDILMSRYIIGKTQMEIAQSLGISQAQVSRLEKTAAENVRRLAS